MPTTPRFVGLGAFAAGLIVASTPAMSQDATLARNLAATCSNCHGTNGNARGDMVPLAGMSAERMLASLADFRSGARPATIMHQIVKGYTEPQLALIAGFYANQKPRP